MSPIPHSYSYQAPTSVGRGPSGFELRLATSPGPDSEAPPIHGRLAHPAVAARMLLTVDQVATTRFCTPPEGDTHTPNPDAPDPVVSWSATGIRFESFSECGGVYARFDLDPDAFEGPLAGSGSASIHVNHDVRSALASIDEESSLSLRIGSAPTDAPLSKDVLLDDDWIRGFSEAAVAASTMEPGIRIRNAGIETFLSGLPTGRARTPLWIEPSGFSLRFSTRSSRQALRAGGVSRLRRLRSFAPLVRSVTVFGDPGRTDRPDAGSTVWLFEVDGGRLSIALSPSSSRTFAGGPGLLRSLQDSDPVGLSSQIHHLERALAGQLGYDAATASWFERTLPYDLGALAESTNP